MANRLYRLFYAIPIYLCLFPAGILSDGQHGHVELVDNKYRGVTIFISDDVSEDRRIISGIKEYLQEASAALFDATRHRAYFHSVNIVVPSSWKMVSTDGIATSDSFDILVDHRNPIYGDGPRVERGGAECGEEGSFIHLTPLYLMPVSYTRTVWGPPGKTLVHEWAKYRWGVYEEYPTGQQLFYLDSGQWSYPSACPKQLSGNVMDVTTSGRCRMGDLNDAQKRSCYFLPNEDHSTRHDTASMMGYYYLPQVTVFCDNNSSNPRTFHNVQAPTAHNQKCWGRSTWEVITQHRDFRNGTNPETGNDVMSTKPDFTVLRRSTPSVLIVLDKNVQLDDTVKRKLNKQLEQLLTVGIETGTKVGVIAFDSRAYLLVNWTTVTNMVDLETIQESIYDTILPEPTSASSSNSSSTGSVEHSGVTGSGNNTLPGAEATTENSTNSENVTHAMRHNSAESSSHEAGPIGAGLEEIGLDNTTVAACLECAMNLIIKVLGERPSDSPFGTDVLIIADETDGDEFQIRPLTLSRDMQLQQAVVTSLTNNASGVLNELSRVTGGQSFSIQNILDIRLSDLLSLSKSSALPKPSLIAEMKTKILTTVVGNVNEEEPQTGRFYIDPAGNMQVEIIIESLGEMRNFILDLTSPHAWRMTLTSEELTFNEKHEEWTHQFDALEVGWWTYSLQSSNNNTGSVRLTVQAKTRREGYRIQINPYTNVKKVNFQDIPVRPLKLFAEVTRGGYQVLHASVSADITTPTGNQVSILLKDNGAGADAESKDGVYSAYFVDFDADGIYSFDIRLNNTLATARGITGRTRTGSLHLKELNPANKPSWDLVQVAAFQRFQAGPIFIVEDFNISRTNIFPPGRITDLLADEIDAENRTFRCTFTAPGDILDKGKVAYYQVRYDHHIEVLRDAFQDANLIADAHIVRGDLNSTFNAGASQSFLIRLPDGAVNATSPVVFIGIKAIGNHGNSMSQLSNIVTVAFTFDSILHNPPQGDPDETTSTMTSATTLSIPAKVPSKQLSTTIVIVITVLGSVCGLFVLIMLILVTVICIQRRNMHKRKRPASPFDRASPSMVSPEYSENNPVFVQRLNSSEQCYFPSQDIPISNGNIYPPGQAYHPTKPNKKMNRDKNKQSGFYNRHISGSDIRDASGPDEYRSASRQLSRQNSELSEVYDTIPSSPDSAYYPTAISNGSVIWEEDPNYHRQLSQQDEENYRRHISVSAHRNPHRARSPEARASCNYSKQDYYRDRANRHMDRGQTSPVGRSQSPRVADDRGPAPHKRMGSGMYSVTIERSDPYTVENKGRDNKGYTGYHHDCKSLR